MKFLIIAYSDVDGVGQHVISLNKNLKRIGHESQTILLHKSENDESLTLVKRSIFKRLIFFFQEFLKKDFKRLFSFGNSTINFKDIKNYIEKSDIIIIYTLHKIISLKMLNKIFESRKIIYMRPLDMELAAGGCHVNTLPDGSECQKFETDCKKCPLLNSLNIFDLSNNIFNKKK